MKTLYLDHPKLVQAIAALRPGKRWTMTGTEVTWLDDDIDPPSQADIFAQIKTSALADGWEKIKTLRDARQAQGIKVGGHWYHTDTDSQLKYFGLLMLGANVPAGLMWKTMSGEFAPMTLQKAQMIFQSVAGMQQNIFAIAERHRIAMEASTDPTGYDYTVGWPLVFGEVETPVIAPDVTFMDDGNITIDLYPYEEPTLSPEPPVVIDLTGSDSQNGTVTDEGTITQE